MPRTIPRICHVFGAFEADDPGAQRCVRLIGALGGEAEHAIVSGDRDRRGAAAGLPRGAKVGWPAFPPLEGKPLPGRLLRLAGAMAGYDLVCTYGWSAIDAAMAHTLFADVHRLAPLVHHELALEDDRAGRSRRRAWYRRIALGRSAALVVPDGATEARALGAWDQPRARVRLIAPGIDTRPFAQAARRDALPGLIKRKDESWLGVLAGEAGPGGDELVAFVRTLAAMPPEWQLVVAGEGAREIAEREAQALGIEDRVHYAGALADERLPAFFSLLDLFASSGGREATIGAMAAGLAVVGYREGEAPGLLSSDNGPFLAEPGDEQALARNLRELAVSPEQRRRIGEANRARAREEFDEARMVERTRSLYWSLMGLGGRQVGD